MNRILKTSSIVFLTIFILTITINKTQLINIEGFYSGFYIIWYTLLSNLVLCLKISVGDLIYILSPLFIIIYFLRIERRRDRFYFIIKIPIIVYCLFYWSWGFNYNKKSEFELLKTNEYSIEDLYFTTEHLIKKTNDLQIIISKSKEKKAVSNLMFDDIKNECIKSIKKSDWMFKNNKTNGFPVKKSIFSTPIQLVVNPLPVVQSYVSLFQCDQDTDGITTFNLNEANSLISSNHLDESFFYYHNLIDAENGDSNFIVDPVSYQNLNFH